MAGMEIDRIEGVHCATGESPTWNALEAAWYWVDIPARRVWRMDHATGALRHWEAPEMVACIAGAVDGSLVAGMETGIHRLVLGEDGKAEATRLSWAKACASTTGAATARAVSGAAPCSWTWARRARSAACTATARAKGCTVRS